MKHPEKHRFKERLSLSEVPSLLRALADSVGNGMLPLGDSIIPMNDMAGFRISLRFNDRKGANRLSLKTVIRPKPAPGPSEGPDGTRPVKMKKLEYKKLKKTLDKNFTSLRRMIKEGKLPDEGSMRDFVLECERMTEFAGKGDGLYGKFLSSVESLRNAAARRDVDKALRAIKDIRDQKNRCHRKYR